MCVVVLGSIGRAINRLAAEEALLAASREQSTEMRSSCGDTCRDPLLRSRLFEGIVRTDSASTRRGSVCIPLESSSALVLFVSYTRA